MINVFGSGSGITRIVKTTTGNASIDLVRVQFSSIGTVKIPHNLSGREANNDSGRPGQISDKAVPVSGNPKKSA